MNIEKIIKEEIEKILLEGAEDKASAMYKMGKKDGLAGEGKDQRSHIRKDSDYTKGYSDGVAERKKKDSKKTNEAKGSGFGDGISPMDAEKLAAKVAEKSRRKLLPGQMVALKKWARENVVGMTTRDAEKKIVDHLK
mgnify:CR=1 FL=1